MSPDPAAVLAPTVTQWGASRYGEYRRCQRAHHLKFHLRVRNAPRRAPENPLEAAADPQYAPLNYFDVGKLVAAGHQWMREGVLAGESHPREWDAVMRAAPECGYGSEEIFEASRLLASYFMHYGSENAGFPEGARILAVEHEMRAPEGSPIAPYTARADAIVQLPSSEIVVVDDKTRASAFPKDRAGYARGAATRPQFAGLAWLVRYGVDGNSEPMRQVLGLRDGEIPAIWINGIIKTRIPKLDRILVPMTHEGLARWEAAQAHDAAGGCKGDAMNYNSCAPEIGSRCQYFDWCHGSEGVRRESFIVGGAASSATPVAEESDEDE